MRPDDVFGPELTAQVSHDDVLAYVKRMKPRDMPLKSYNDLITILEYLQEDILRTQETLLRREADLAEREQSMQQLEQELHLRRRAVDMVMHGHEPPKSKRFLFF